MSRDEGFEKLRTLFAADLSEKIRALEAAVKDSEWNEVSSISHQIKGTAKSFGYPEISSVAAEIENSASKKSPEYTAGLVKRISDLIVL